MSFILEDDWNDADFLNTPVGSGANSGHHNITVYRNGNTAYLDHIISNGPGNNPTLKTRVNLSTHTARIRVNNGNLAVSSAVGTGAHDPAVSHVIPLSSTGDVKVTLNCPLADNSVAIVGAEDARNGVQGSRGDHNIYTLPPGTSSEVRFSQHDASSLKASYYVASERREAIYEAFCDTNGSSTSGVPLWGKNFHIACQ